jgi:hypothetical protein
VHFGGRSGMQCQAPDAPQCEHCKWRATPQCARYGQQKCATYSCAGPKLPTRMEKAGQVGSKACPAADENGMSELLTCVIDAHGGFDRWKTFQKVHATIVTGGAF